MELIMVVKFCGINKLEHAKMAIALCSASFHFFKTLFKLLQLHALFGSVTRPAFYIWPLGMRYSYPVAAVIINLYCKKVHLSPPCMSSDM